MPIIGAVAIMFGLVLMYLGFTGSTIGDLAKSVLGP